MSVCVCLCDLFFVFLFVPVSLPKQKFHGWGLSEVILSAKLNYFFFLSDISTLGHMCVRESVRFICLGTPQISPLKNFCQAFVLIPAYQRT